MQHQGAVLHAPVAVDEVRPGRPAPGDIEREVVQVGQLGDDLLLWAFRSAGC